MKEAVLFAGSAVEFYTEEDCYITELSNSASDNDVSIAHIRVLKGVTTRWYYLQNTTERYVILEGIGCVEVGELPPQKVQKGDVVLIPPMCRQRITNIGEGELLFLAVCSPRFKQEVYVSI